MNGTSKIPLSNMKRVFDIITGSKEAIFSAWRKAKEVTSKSDLLAIVQENEKDVSITVLPRETGLVFLNEQGCDTQHPNLRMLNEAATGLTPNAPALWVVVRFDDFVHVAKIADQPMSSGGSA
jgi:hypothetical protein